MSSRFRKVYSRLATFCTLLCISQRGEPYNIFEVREQSSEVARLSDHEEEGGLKREGLKDGGEESEHLSVSECDQMATLISVSIGSDV